MPDIYNPNNSMSVKDYAAFFRIIYNSSYLERNMSEKALSLLSSVDYKEGLIAGVPSNLVVSHKFGERQAIDKNGGTTNQLHDCGIVYYPGHPYLLCVMTKGEKFEELSKIIAKISDIVYREIDSRSH
jgi:beta-lactamase class A